MSYETAVASMFALGHELANTPSQKFDLEHMRALLRKMNHPERAFPSVLIAGTNGKGSTAATLASILRASGLKTGLYTSPHLVRINERIRVNGKEISDDEFAALHGQIDQIAGHLVDRRELPWHPSFFEMMTAIAFAHFAHERAARCNQRGRTNGQCDCRYLARSSEVPGQHGHGNCPRKGRNHSSRRGG